MDVNQPEATSAGQQEGKPPKAMKCMNLSLLSTAGDGVSSGQSNVAARRVVMKTVWGLSRYLSFLSPTCAACKSQAFVLILAITAQLEIF